MQDFIHGNSNLGKGVYAMPISEIHKTLLFATCANLNTENCPFRTERETILPLIGDPNNLWKIRQKIQELNEICSGCSSFKKKKK